MADARYADLDRKLAARGWAVVHRDRDVEWWADEVWRGESVWAPRGFTVFVAWLLDPQDLTALWGVAAFLERPAAETRMAVSVSINRWPRDVPEFLAALDALRDEHLRPST